jgi:hypothetical protein
MVLIRLAVLFLILYVIFTVLRSLLRTRSARPEKLRSERAAEDMVLDPQCRSYLPRSEAFAHSGKYFCSRECARQYLSGQGA